MKIVVVSPHRDDACFSLGLSIGCWIEATHTVVVVNCFTQSEYAPFGNLLFARSRERPVKVSSLRLREDIAWQQMYPLGLHFVDLNLKDAPLRLHVEVNQVIGRPLQPNDRTMSKLPRAVTALKPDAVVIPLALGGHVDHLTAQAAIIHANPVVLSERLPVAFYEDLPYAAWPGLAKHIDNFARNLDQELVPTFSFHEMPAEVAIERKRRLASCYDSQITPEVAEQIARFSAAYGGRERLWAGRTWCAAEWLQPKGPR